MHASQTYALALLAATASAFQSAPLTRTPSPSLPLLAPLPPSHHSQRTILYQQEGEDNEEEYEMVEYFFVTPEQITALRKETSKRERSKKLPKFFLPPAESNGEISPETFDEICKLFESGELLEVRGVSRDKKKRVFDTAHGLAATLEDSLEKPVVVVDIKGFAAKLYCPFDDDSAGQRIQLYNSYKPGQWKRKAKPIRDNRGQIIIDEGGKSIKETPGF